MFSYCLVAAKKKLSSLFLEFCPCFDPEYKKSHKIDDKHRKTRIMNSWEVDPELGGSGKGKIFTVETMKKLAMKRVCNKDLELVNTKDSFILEQCPWDSGDSDMILRVERSIFPVHRFLLSIESEILRTIIDSVPANENKTTVVTLNGYKSDEIKMLLTFVYLPEAEINDSNVLTILNLADELMIEELVIRCEEFLMSYRNHSPVLLLKIAHKYQLPSLEESAAIKASKIRNIDQDPEFRLLDEKQREKVLNMSRNRFWSYSDTFEGQSEASNRGIRTQELKMERRLRDDSNKFEGRLNFLPERKTLDQFESRTRS